MWKNPDMVIQKYNIQCLRNPHLVGQKYQIWCGRNTKSSMEEIHMWLGRNTKSSVEEIHMWLGRDRWAGLDWAARVGLLQLEGFPASVTNNNVIACRLEVIIFHPSKFSSTNIYYSAYKHSKWYIVFSRCKSSMWCLSSSWMGSLTNNIFIRYQSQSETGQGC